jgi:beta-lactamase class A
MKKEVTPYSFQYLKKYVPYLLGFCGAGILFFFIFGGAKDFFLKAASSQYDFLNPSVNLIHKEDLLVNFEPLRQKLNTKYEKDEEFLVSLYFEYLPTGANININRDERIWPASLIKIPVAMSAMKKVEEGKWSLDNELVILDEDKDGEFGSLYKQQTGTTFTIERFLEETLINSDNTAHFVLLRNIDASELEDAYLHLGMDDIIDGLKKAPKDREYDNRITAKRYTIFFRSLYNSTFLSPEYSELFLDILERAPKEYLNLGMPESVNFVHKTGIRTDERVWADSGIVYIPGRPYLITVMVQQKGVHEGEMDAETNEKVKAIFKGIAEDVYSYVSTTR